MWVWEPRADTGGVHREIVAHDDSFLASLLEVSAENSLCSAKGVAQRVMIQNDISTVNDNHDKCCIP